MENENKEIIENPFTEIREDLKHAQEAISKGWEPQFHSVDARHGRTQLDGDFKNCPHWPVSFKKGDFKIWSTREGWHCGLLVGNFYHNIQQFPTLLEALAN